MAKRDLYIGLALLGGAGLLLYWLNKQKAFALSPAQPAPSPAQPTPSPEPPESPLTREQLEQYIETKAPANQGLAEWWQRVQEQFQGVEVAVGTSTGLIYRGVL